MAIMYIITCAVHEPTKARRYCTRVGHLVCGRTYKTDNILDCIYGCFDNRGIYVTAG